MATFQDGRKDATDESSTGQHDVIWMKGGDVRLSDNQGEIWGLFGTLGGSRPGAHP